MNNLANSHGPIEAVLAPPVVSRIDAFRDAIDESYDTSQSIVLRYRNAILLERDRTVDDHLKQMLLRTSLREGVRIINLCRYRGVYVDLLDETTLMRTRTLKSIDGCVTTAQCLLRGHQKIVFESGGNTGVALTVYGSSVGLETFLLLPAHNLELLDSRDFSGNRVHVMTVRDPELLKSATSAYARQYGLVRVPKLSWRLQASTFIGCFVLEHLLGGTHYDYIAQSISAAFGPIGIYGILKAHRANLGRLPKFLGVQQKANCPMVQALGNTAETSSALDDRLLARVMYDRTPSGYGTTSQLAEILRDPGGELMTLDHEQFRLSMTRTLDGGNALEMLSGCGVKPSMCDGEILEKTGLMALAGTIREIDADRFAPGTRVLVCITGGTASPDGKVRAEMEIDDCELLSASADNGISR